MLIVLARNITDLAEVSDYDVEVRVNKRTLWRGRVVGHERADGWTNLLRAIASEKDREG